MKPRIPLAVLAAGAVLVLAACGGDDGDGTDATTEQAATTTSVQTTSANPDEMTAGEYMAASIAEMTRVVKELVAEHPDECEGIDPKAGGKFQQAFAIDAAMASPETPLSEIIVESCRENLAGKGTA